jgi:hypothetical protein
LFTRIIASAPISEKCRVKLSSLFVIKLKVRWCTKWLTLFIESFKWKFHQTKSNTL